MRRAAASTSATVIRWLARGMITIEFSPPSSTSGRADAGPLVGVDRDAGRVDALGGQAIEEARAEVVGAEPADHRGGRAGPGGGDGLVAALAAEEHVEAAADERLARLRAAGRAHDEIHHEAAHDGDAGAAHAGPSSRAPERAAGVVLVEVVRSEALGDHQPDGEGIADDRGDRGRRGGRQVVRIGLALDPDVDDRVGQLAQHRAAAAPRHRDHRDAPRLHHAREPLDLGRAARLRDGQQDVAGRHHAGVAVQRVGGVDEERRRAGAGEGGGQLGADEPGLAEPRHHDAALVASSSSRAGATWSKRSAARATSRAACAIARRPASSAIGGAVALGHRRSGTMRSPVTWLT